MTSLRSEYSLKARPSGDIVSVSWVESRRRPREGDCSSAERTQLTAKPADQNKTRRKRTCLFGGCHASRPRIIRTPSRECPRGRTLVVARKQCGSARGVRVCRGIQHNRPNTFFLPRPIAHPNEAAGFVFFVRCA